MQPKETVYVITHLPDVGGARVICACLEAGHICELSLEPPAGQSILGNIYVGKVNHISRNLDAAFIEIEKGILCFYPISDMEPPIYVSEKKGAKLVPGDELLVQVEREALKTKAPSVTSNLSFPGKYLVLTTGKRHLGLSSKLSAPERIRLEKIAAPFLNGDFGIIVRTNAAGVSKEELEQEFLKLKALANQVITHGRCQTCFSLVHREFPDYVTRIRGLQKESLTRVVTDDPAIYADLFQYFSTHQPEDLKKLSLYEAPAPSLAAVYGIGKALEEALRERVWLSLGGYLVIEPTEALTVIDVNTGKYSGHKKREETFLKINLEAAREIARQLRIRNLSGIIVVDFIDLKNAADRSTLMETLRQELSRDPVKTVLVDMTPLGLVEITRKKTRKSLSEQMAFVDES